MAAMARMEIVAPASQVKDLFSLTSQQHSWAQPSASSYSPLFSSRFAFGITIEPVSSTELQLKSPNKQTTFPILTNLVDRQETPGVNTNLQASDRGRDQGGQRMAKHENLRAALPWITAITCDRMHRSANLVHLIFVSSCPSQGAV